MNHYNRYAIMQNRPDDGPPGGRRRNVIDPNQLNENQRRQMRGRRRPALFLNITWRDARYEAPVNPQMPPDAERNPNKPLMRSWECSRELPDIPLVAGGMSGFEFGESLICSVINDDLVRKVANERDQQRQDQGRPGGGGRPEDILCCSALCGKRARGAVVWYPYDTDEWDGRGVPQMVEAMPDLEFADNQPHTDEELARLNAERIAVGIPMMAWCGSDPICKWNLLGFMLQQYGPVAAARGLTGGRTYCWQCGTMNGADLKTYEGRGVWCSQCNRPDGGRKLCSPYGVKKQ